MLRLLDAELDLRAAFSAPEIHRWQRLPADASFDRFLDYYRDKVRVIVDSSSLLHVQARGFTSEQARALANSIIARSEDMLNGVSRQLAAKQVDFIRVEVGKAETLFKDRTQQLAVYQNQAGQLDPNRTSESLMAVIARMERELAEQNTILAGQRTFISADSPRFVEAVAAMQALTSGIRNRRERLVGLSETARSLSQKIMKFNDAAMETQFAAKTYASALLALQAPHAHGPLNIRTLIVSAQPSTL